MENNTDSVLANLEQVVSFLSFEDSFLIQESVGDRNPEYSFPTFSTNSQESINWTLPGDEKIEALPKKTLTVSNISGVVNDSIKGLRGFVVGVGSGLRLYDGDAKETICYTVGGSYNGQLIEKVNPLPVPIYNPLGYIDKKEEEAGKVAPPAKELSKWGLRGSRGFSCEECVLNGQNVYVDEKGGKHQCGGGTQITFVVTHLALTILQNLDKPEGELHWVPVTELKEYKEAPVNLFDSPVCLRLSVSRSVSIQSTKSYEYDKKDSSIPHKDLQTLRDFLWSAYRTQWAKQLTGHHIVLTGEVEMWLSKPVKPIQNVKSVPLFKFSRVDCERDFMKAFGVFQKAFTENGGQLDSKGSPIYPKPVVRQQASLEYTALPNTEQKLLEPAAVQTVQATSIVSTPVQPVQNASKPTVKTNFFARQK